MKDDIFCHYSKCSYVYSKDAIARQNYCKFMRIKLTLWLFFLTLWLPSSSILPLFAAAAEYGMAVAGAACGAERLFGVGTCRMLLRWVALSFRSTSLMSPIIMLTKAYSIKLRNTKTVHEDMKISIAYNICIW